MFVIFLTISTLLVPLPWWLPTAYAAMSGLAVVVYWGDKAAAKRGARRTPEQTLHLVGVLGGWPGALIAQQLFRHKTRKKSFQLEFWITVIINLGALIALIVWAPDWIMTGQLP